MRRAPLVILLTAATLLASGMVSAFSFGDWLPWGRTTVPKEQPVRQTEAPVGGGVPFIMRA
jgi:hypothetical protein